LPNKGQEKKEQRDDWHNIYDGIQKRVGLGQFGEEKTSRTKSRIKTDPDQTKGIKHNRHFVLGDNCILVELLI
jgi:hypothetical protein